MAFEPTLNQELDYQPCRYGKSRLQFRGPRKTLRDGYVAFLGSTETYGKYVSEPFPDQLEQALGKTALNLGAVNAGIDTFLHDPTVLELVAGADAVVLQSMGADRLSNRLYSVHPRRNDRFTSASDFLITLFPEAEFTEVHFTRHLLAGLRALDADRFRIVEEELAAAWIARMSALITTLDVPVILLTVRGGAAGVEDGCEPLFVTDDMVARVAERAAGSVVVDLAPHADGTPEPGMIYPELEIGAALRLPGPGTHRQIAAELSPLLRPLI